MSDLTDFRTAKDAMFRDSANSPLTAAQRKSFQGLAYYPENRVLIFSCVSEPLEGEPVTLQTSTGDTADYLRSARVTFAVEGREVAMTVFTDPSSGELFLPFRDMGTVGETYEAGRYLEVEVLVDGRLLLDFNYAYNPYCAYNDGWSCPLTPAENRVQVPIRAGERSFH